MPRSSGLDPELQTLLLQIVDATRELPRHEQEWNLYAGLLRAPGVELQVLDHDVLTLADMGFLHTTNLNYVYGNDYIVTKLGYEHAEIIREGQVVQTEPTGWAAVDATTDKLRSQFARAHDPADFKAVGLTCADALEALGRAAFDPRQALARWRGRTSPRRRQKPS